MDLATRVGGSIKKEDVQSAVDRYISLFILFRISSVWHVILRLQRTALKYQLLH